jgi:hypothetical protein
LTMVQIPALNTPQFSWWKLAFSKSIRRCHGIVGLLLKASASMSTIALYQLGILGVFRIRPGLDWIPTI